MPPRALILGDGLRHLPTRRLTRDRLGDLAQSTRHEQLAINTEPIFDMVAVRAAAPLDRKLLARGIRLRVLGVQSLDTDPLASFGPLSGERQPDYWQALSVPIWQRRNAGLPSAHPTPSSLHRVAYGRAGPPAGG